MKCRLILLRHAKSAWDTDAPSDHERPLNKRGRRDAPRIGAKLAELGWLPDRVLASDSARTRQTWERMRDALQGDGSPEVEASRKLYHAGIDAIRELVGEGGTTAKTIMVIGHNPGWEDAAEALTGESIRMTTCNAVLLSTKAPSWSEALGASDWNVEHVLRPKEL
ncbi:MAG: histidine phosphatase family protein [Polyangiaceae bacterium]